MVPVSTRHASEERTLDVALSPTQAGPSPAPRPDALSTLVGLLEPDLEACNRTIVARMDSPVTLIPQLAAHIVAAGGKRLRPLLTRAAARACGVRREAAVDA